MDTNPGDDTLTRARDALSRHAWKEAREAFETAAATAPLGADDLTGLAESCWWTGDVDAAIAAREPAHAMYVEAGNPCGAANTAIGLAADYGHKASPSIAAGWRARAERILKDLPESPEHGWLKRAYTNIAFDSGRFEEALTLAGELLQIANRVADRDLQAMAIHEQGRALVRLGRVEEGMALLDEAAVAAVGGELESFATAVIYCNVIGACRSLADYRRAGDWTEAAKRWCERQSIAGFPGVCRVYRAEIMRLRGDWTRAEEEARSACDELKTFALDIVGAGFNEIGEVRLRIGDLQGAEEAFREAHEAGVEPQPGLALLRLAQGNTAAAATSIKRALQIDPSDRLARARLLPAFVEITLASGELAEARQGQAELQQIAESFGSDALRASADFAAGCVLLAAGDAAGAVPCLRNAFKIWQGSDTPYEAARARLRLAQTYRLQGDEDAAQLEAGSARSAFLKLGARLDVLKADEFLAAEAPAPATPVTRQTRTFMFTDICRSTNLVEAIGDEAWEDILRWHDAMLRECFTAHSGEEIKHGGDGFFVAFPDAYSAIDCAIGIQRRLADHRRDHGFSPQVRIGLHAAEATSRGKDYFGKGVNVAARIGALAGAGEILISRETAPNGDWNVSQPREVTLKGIGQPVEIVSIDWR